jgi:hypothetical protein
VRILAESPYFTITVDDHLRIVRLTRTPKRFRSLEDSEAILAKIRTMDPYRREPYALLMDARQGPTRPDPAFEPLLRRLRREAERGFRRRAMLLASVVGAAHTRRMRDDDDGEIGTFVDEKEAIDYLTAAPGRNP